MLGRSFTASYERSKSPFSSEFAVMGRVQGQGRGSEAGAADKLRAAKIPWSERITLRAGPRHSDRMA